MSLAPPQSEDGPTIIIHGCRSNLAERDALAALAPAGSTVINSCAVTAEAVRDARAAVRAASGQGPVFITGCAATLDPARFADIAQIVPNTRKLDPAFWGREKSVPPVTRKSRAFVAVQDGCDHECTFCVTRLARGASRSVPLADVVARVASMADAGVAEVVLTGIDTTSYGQDLPDRYNLGELVQAILGKTRIRRLRLSSLDSAEADAALIEAFSDPRLMPHVHLSLQSGDDLILKRMKRRHSRQDAIRLVERLKAVRPDLAVGADLIAGFPTETAEAHANSMALLDDCDIVHAHIFSFSPRPETPAARMPQVPVETAKARTAQLRTRAAQRLLAFQSGFIGKPVESISEGASGITPEGLKLRYRQAHPRGQIRISTPTAIQNGQLSE